MKKLGVLLYALAKVAVTHPTINLVIAGDGPEAQQLHRLRAHLGLEDNVTLVGNRNDVPALLKSAAVFVSRDP